MKPKTGDRATVSRSQGTCEHLWGHKGTITKTKEATNYDPEQYLVKFDKPVPSPAKYWPSMSCCWLPETGITL